MRQYLDKHSKITEIRLELRHPTNKNNLWILVEGETDQKLYAKLINGSNTKVETVPGGVKSLCCAVGELIKETNRVIGIRDADFLRLDKQVKAIPCLFLTDAHDAEIMMLSCDAAFESLVSEFIESRRTDFDILRRQILESIAFLGGIRWLNHAQSLELNFKGLGLATFSIPVVCVLTRIAVFRK